ncbi:MAG: GGDEF domain-containing protein [Treponema sp.]|nr:GGDEF domain-containing protein [Treponema sp.]
MNPAPNVDPVLINSPFFNGLSALEFNAVLAFMERRRLAQGEKVFEEGDKGEDMFVLLSGSLSAHRAQSDGTQRLMFSIAPGAFFGEMSIIANEPRSATIIAKEISDIMVLQGIDFYRIIFEHPMIGVRILNSIGSVQTIWFNQTSRHLKDLATWGEAARRRAITDELTGLYNKSFLEESIRDKFKLGSVGARKMSLIMIDLDRVHAINDAYGTQAGDKVIIAVAEILKNTGRPGDMAARLSGDEYAVLLPDTDGRGAFGVAEHIRQNVMNSPVKVAKSPGSRETVTLDVRASFGIAVAPVHASNERELVFAADSALRRAKEQGRNRSEIARQGGEPSQR